MASGGMELLFLLVGLWTASPTLCFNLEPLKAQLFYNPLSRSEGRESYFGFSVALQHNEATKKNWLMVGAPRANSSFYNRERITEPGVLFKCDLSGKTCSELVVDNSGNTPSDNYEPEFSYHDLKNFGWLGGSLDSQPRFQEGRQVTGVCAPRWKNQFYPYHRYMNGVCYWFEDPDSLDNPKKELPLVNHRKQTISIYYRTFYNYAHGQAGMSIHFPDDQTTFLIGAPGLFNWHGTVILYRDFNWVSPDNAVQRRRRQVRRNRDNFFNEDIIPDPYYMPLVQDSDLFGYAVTSGNFSASNKVLYAAGAPRGADSYGKVLVFDFPTYEYSDLLVKVELKGTQLGEYFGASLTAADINGDGLTDLVVGSPMYSLPDISDVGRVQTFISSRGRGLRIRPKPHYGNQVYLARFGTTLASPGDLNNDRYEDIVVGAPWEGNGAVYIFLGSSGGLKQQYSQRLSPEDFSPGLKGFGISLSRGIDVDENGYPDLAIGSFMSGHAVVVKSRPVAVLTGYLRASPPNVAWEGESTINLMTCLQYKGYRVPTQSSIKVTLILDHESPAPRAVFSDSNNFIQTFIQDVVANRTQEKCRTDKVNVKDDKIDPDQPMVMKMEYELVPIPNLDLIQQPMTNPGEVHSSLTRVGILKGCAEKICRVDMTFNAKLEIGKGSKLVIGEQIKSALVVAVANNGEPAYLPGMTVNVDPPLSLLLPLSHDCKFFDAELRTSLECSLSNPIKKGSVDTVEVHLDTSQLMDTSSYPMIKVEVTGEGEEVNSEDNHLNMTLQLEAQASLELFGHSKEEQVVYKHVDEKRINATVNPKFTHTFLLIKKGPTPLSQVDLNIDIPVNITDGQKLVKLYSPTTDFMGQPFHCKLNSGSFDIEVSGGFNEDDGISADDGEESGSDVEPHNKPLIVSVDKEGTGTQYFNCSSSLMKCVQLSCRIYNWPQDTNSAKIVLDMEIDLSVMAKHVNLKGGAVLMSKAIASIESLNPLLTFEGKEMASRKIVTNIQPDTLQTKGIPWWIILLAVMGGFLLLGLMAYGLYKTGFFRREKMEEMKAQQAHLLSSDKYGACNPSQVAD